MYILVLGGSKHHYLRLLVPNSIPVHYGCCRDSSDPDVRLIDSVQLACPPFDLLVRILYGPCCLYHRDLKWGPRCVGQCRW